MDLELIEKHVHLTPTMTGVEVMFGGQVCLTVAEAGDGYCWRINELFAKMTYGANVFEDIPFCFESTESIEESVASGLTILYELGAFYGLVDLPEDTYAVEELNEAAYEKDIDEKKPVVAHGVKGMKSVPFKKKFKSMAHYAKWTDSDDFGNHEVHRVVQESEELNEASHQELLAGAQKAYIAATRQGNGVMAKAYAADILKHKNNIAKQKKLKESEELLERDDREDDEGYARTKNKDDAANERNAAKKIKYPAKKTPEQEKAEWDKWVKESVMADCRKEAMKHSDSVMEAHALAIGLYESFVELDEGFADSLKDRAKQLVKKLNEPLRDKYVDQMDAIGDAVNKRRNDAINKKYKPKNDAVVEAALSGDAYWKAKEDEAAAAKAKEERAKMGIKEPVKKGRGKPTLIDRDDLHVRAKENVTAGKRPTTGFDRNEKIHFVRHLKDHPDFAEHHVSAAGRPHGTTKAAGEEKTKEKKQAASAFSMWAGLGKK